MPKTKSKTPEQEELGRFLRDLRKARGFSLRRVEEITNGAVSNAYLSQIENGQIKRPSAATLNSLSAAYGIDYNTILERAGLADDMTSAAPALDSIFGMITAEEERELLRYLAFLRKK